MTNIQSKWTQKDIDYLLINHREGFRNCAIALNKSVRAIQMKCFRLQLKLRKIPKDGCLICTDCKQEKSKSSFYSCKSSKLVRQHAYYCKSCAKQRINTLKYRTSGWASKTICQHKEKGYQIDFSVKTLTQKARTTITCEFCLKPLNWFNQTIKHDSPSLDRLDNNKILYLNDIAIVCYQCNATKRNRTLSEFLNYVTDIAPKLTVLLQQKSPSGKSRSGV